MSQTTARVSSLLLGGILYVVMSGQFPIYAQECEGQYSQCGVAGVTCCAPYACVNMPNSGHSWCDIPPTAAPTSPPKPTATPTPLPAPTALAAVCTNSNKNFQLSWNAVAGSSGKYNVSIAYEPYGAAQTRNAIIVNATTHTTYTYWDNPPYAKVRFRATVKAIAPGENEYVPRGAGATVDVYCPYSTPSATATPTTTQAPSGTNLAKGKPILKHDGNIDYGTQVSSWPKVNDGDPATYWLVNTNGTPRTDVVIDLGAVHTLSSVAYVLLADTNFGPTSPIETYVSLDNATWTKVATTTVTNSRTNVTTVSVNNAKARYLRSRWGDGPWNGWAEFREIMAYGAQPTPTTKPTVTVSPTPVASLTASPSATLAVTPTPDCSLRPKGDADCSGVVDAADYAIWYAVYRGKTPSAGHNPDFDGNGKTTLVDLELWTRNIGLSR